MAQGYDPARAQESSSETGERHQVIVKEFPDVRSGLLVEVYHYREDVNNVVRSASNEYIEAGYMKSDDSEFIDGHTKDVFVDEPESLYAGVYDVENGFLVEVGEGVGHDDPNRTVLFAHTYTLGELRLEDIDFD